MVYKVQHWAVGYNVVGDAPSPDVVDHGLSAADALAAVVGHMEWFASMAAMDPESVEMELRFEEAAKSYSEPDLVGEVELAARKYGHHAGFSVTVGRIEFWVMPCFAENCDQIGSE